MANIYRILQASSLIKSKRITLFGIWLFHIIGKRYTGLFFDPVLACNFRCKMCYFSDDEFRKGYKGISNYEEIEAIAKALFHRALKLQLGCGAEPTLHKDLTKIIALGKEYRIPYISLTTNGALLNKENLREMVEAGLNELTLSCHGLTKETYEYLMGNGDFEHFKQLLKDVSELKQSYPAFRLRINYTVNNANMDELGKIWEVVDDLDILQVRPIQKIGETAYSDFDLTNIYESYDRIFVPLIEEGKKRGVTCLVPGKQNIIALENKAGNDDRIEQSTYCYVSPRSCWRDDFDYQTETFEDYAKRTRMGRQLFRNIWAKSKPQQVNVTHKLNYNIK